MQSNKLELKLFAKWACLFWMRSLMCYENGQVLANWCLKAGVLMSSCVGRRKKDTTHLENVSVCSDEWWRAIRNKEYKAMTESSSRVWYIGCLLFLCFGWKLKTIHWRHFVEYYVMDSNKNILIRATFDFYFQLTILCLCYGDVYSTLEKKPLSI